KCSQHDESLRAVRRLSLRRSRSQKDVLPKQLRLRRLVARSEHQSETFDNLLPLETGEESSSQTSKARSEKYCLRARRRSSIAVGHLRDLLPARRRLSGAGHKSESWRRQ